MINPVEIVIKKLGIEILPAETLPQDLYEYFITQNPAGLFYPHFPNHIYIFNKPYSLQEVLAHELGHIVSYRQNLGVHEFVQPFIKENLKIIPIEYRTQYQKLLIEEEYRANLFALLLLEKYDLTSISTKLMITMYDDTYSIFNKQELHNESKELFNQIKSFI